MSFSVIGAASSSKLAALGPGALASRDPQQQVRIGSWVENITTVHGSRGSPQSSSDATAGLHLHYSGLDRLLAPLDSPKLKVPAPIQRPGRLAAGASAGPLLLLRVLPLRACPRSTYCATSATAHRYCSPILVNALLGLGCRFSSQPNTRTKPDDP